MEQPSQKEARTIQKTPFTLDFLRIINDPIGGFYSHFAKTLDIVIENFIANEFVDNQARQNEIQEQTALINEQKQAIVDKKRMLKITQMKWRRAVIFVLFFVLFVGFIFWKQFQHARKNISEFNQFETETLAKIRDAVNFRFKMIKSAFSTFQLSDIYEYVYSQYGIRISELLPKTELFNIIKDNSAVDLEAGIVGYYRNNPFYDILTKHLYYEDVTTSQSQSFPYWTTERILRDDKWITKRVQKFEVLTAYHRESTPFIHTENYLIFKTNFAPELTIDFKKNSNHDPNSLRFINADFQKYFNVRFFNDQSVSQIQLEQKVKEIFTLAAQENFVNWYRLNNGFVDSFNKTGNIIKISGVFGYKASMSMFSLINELGILHKEENVDLDTVKNQVHSLVKSYFERIVSMLQIPLLSPRFSAEWYRDDAPYNVANNIDGLLDPIQPKIDYSYTPNRFLSYRSIWWANDALIKRPGWFQLIDSRLWNHGIVVNYYKMHSFTSEILIDHVPVVGVHVGLQIIPVQYERFYKYYEDKYIYHLYFETNKYCRMVISPENGAVIFDNLYSSKEILELVQTHRIWCNNPSWLNEFNDKQALEKILQKFAVMNELFANSLVLAIDNYGVYLISNKYQLDAIKQEIEWLFLEIVSLFNNI